MSAQEQEGSELNLRGLMQDGLRELIELVGTSGVTELKIERGETRLYIKSKPAVATSPDVMMLPDGAPPLTLVPDLEPQASRGVPIVSPIVGTYYASARPNSPAFVEVGDHVEPGQTVGIVEAMKIMNEIEAEVSGRITDILVQNGQAVEYGQPLMYVDISAGRTE